MIASQCNQLSSIERICKYFRFSSLFFVKAMWESLRQWIHSLRITGRYLAFPAVYLSSTLLSSCVKQRSTCFHRTVKFSSVLHETLKANYSTQHQNWTWKQHVSSIKEYFWGKWRCCLTWIVLGLGGFFDFKEKCGPFIVLVRLSYTNELNTLAYAWRQSHCAPLPWEWSIKKKCISYNTDWISVLHEMSASS